MSQQQRKESVLKTQELDEGVDYLWCSACGRHVECLRTAEGWWEVLCPLCSGECGFCRCHLRDYCFGRLEGTPPLRPGTVAPECPYPPDRPRRLRT